MFFALILAGNSKKSSWAIPRIFSGFFKLRKLLNIKWLSTKTRKEQLFTFFILTPVRDMKPTEAEIK